MNDYRTLLLHIFEQQISIPQEDYNEEGFVVLRQCHTAAQQLLSSDYQPCPVSGNGDAETEKAELQRYLHLPSTTFNPFQQSSNNHTFNGRVIIDSSTRRFQAHKIYLQAAAARRWSMTREKILGTNGQRPTAAHTPALEAAQTTLRQELARVTDDHVVTDLRAADLRSGYWLDDDPSLHTMRRWIQGR